MMTLPFFNGPLKDLAAARMNPAVGPITGFMENISSSWDAMLATEMTWSEHNNVLDAFEQNAALYEELSGQPVPEMRMLTPAEARDGSVEDVLKAKWETLQPAIQKLIDENPEHKDKFLMSIEDIKSKSRENALGVLQENEYIAERADGYGTLGQFIGSTGAFLTEPTLWATLPFGGPIGQGVKSLGTFALREAGLSMVGEAIAQSQVQSYREQLGLDAGFEEGLKRVATAGVFGGAFGAVMGGSVQGVRGLMNTLRDTGKLPPVSNRAIDEMEIQATEREANPSLETGTMEQHNKFLNSSLEDISKGYMPDIETPAFSAREDLISGTSVRLIDSLEVKPDIDFQGLPEIATAFKSHFDLARSEKALKELDLFARVADYSDMQTINNLKNIETRLQNVTRQYLFLNNEIAAKVGRGRKATPDQIMKELDPEFYQLLKTTENPTKAMKKKEAMLWEDVTKIEESKLEDLYARQNSLNKDLKSLHEKRTELVKTLNKDQQPKRQGILSKQPLNKVTSDYFFNPISKENPAPVRSGAAQRETAANTSYERLVKDTDKQSELNEAQWSSTSAVLKEDLKASYFFDDIDDFGNTFTVSKSGEQILKEIEELDTLVSELTACIASPVGVPS